MCFLKGPVGDAYAAEGVVARLKVKAPDAPASCSADYGDLQTDKDLAGNMLKQVSGSSEAACCAECDKVSGCEGYAYSSQWKMCFLKGSVGEAYAQAGVVARTKKTEVKAPIAPKACSADYGDLQTDKDLAGEMLKQVSGSSEAACCAECDELEGCQGYAYSGEWKMCFLKGSAEGTFPAAGVVTRMKTKAPVAPASCSADYGDLQTDRDLRGMTLKQVSGSSEAACCAECDEVGGCEGFAYSARWKMCFLKGPVVGTHPAEGVVVRTKVTVPAGSL